MLFHIVNEVKLMEKSDQGRVSHRDAGEEK